MVGSRFPGTRGWASPCHRAFVVAALVMVLPLSSCAVMFNGTTQSVPVTSNPERAEVFVDGESVGITPIEIELTRNRDHRIEVRYGDQTRTFVLESDVQGAMVGLDLVPVGFAGGVALLGAALSPLAVSDPTVTLVAVVGVSLTPILVDFGTGAAYRLNPREVLAVFE